MKKPYLILTAAAACALLSTGCSKNSSIDYSKYVTVGDYSGLLIDRVVYTVTDDDVKDEINNTLYAYSETNDITDRPCKEGDLVNIDYTGTIDGIPFEGGSETDAELELGSGDFIEGFEEQIIGMSVNETADIKVTFPADYDEALAGREANFAIKLNSITETILPEYNDAFVQEYTDYTTTAEYEEAIKKELVESYNTDSQQSACMDALNEIIAASDFNGAPDGLLEKTKEELEASNQEIADMFGIDDISALFGEDYDINAAAEEAMNEKLLVQAIAQKEKITVTDKDIDAYFEENYEYYGYESAKDFKEAANITDISYELLYSRVLDHIAGVIMFNDISDEEYYGSLDESEDGEIIEDGEVFDENGMIVEE